MRIIALSMPIDSTSGRKGINATIEKDNENVIISISDDHPNWSQALEGFNNFSSGDFSNEELATLLNDKINLKAAVEENIKNIEGTRMKVVGNSITVDFERIDPVLEGHILRLLDSNGKPKDKENWKAYSNFVENLYTNQSKYVRDQLFGWLSYENNFSNGFTLTSDGCFIGYKGCAGTVDAPTSINSGTAFVNNVKHVGRIPNPIGAIVEMPRSEVQDDPSIGCSAGLHVGTYDFANNHFNQGVLLSVKVNPRDVVSVPVECDAQKIRVCRYEILESVEVAYTELTYFNEEETDSEDYCNDCDYGVEDCECCDCESCREDEITENSLNQNVPETEYSSNNTVVCLLKESLNNDLLVEITYTDSNNVTTVRKIKVEHFDNSYSVGAYCHLAEDYRTFYLKNIKNIVLVENDKVAKFQPIIVVSSNNELTGNKLIISQSCKNQTKISLVYKDDLGRVSTRVTKVKELNNNNFVTFDDMGNYRTFLYSGVLQVKDLG